MKTPTSRALAALTALLATAHADLSTWVSRAIPTAQKLAEIAGIEAQIAALS